MVGAWLVHVVDGVNGVLLVVVLKLWVEPELLHVFQKLTALPDAAKFHLVVSLASHGSTQVLNL